MVKDAKNLIVGLDVGTSKIVAIVAEVTPEKRLNIIGMGTQPSRGPQEGRGGEHRGDDGVDPARA
jgi:cell division protein FtsA